MAKKVKKPTTKVKTIFKFKMPVIPDDVNDPAHYVRGYNGANTCPLKLKEIRDLIEESLTTPS